jgi:hypothetical protein
MIHLSGKHVTEYFENHNIFIFYKSSSFITCIVVDLVGERGCHSSQPPSACLRVKQDLPEDAKG